ncbi:MAG: DUF1521 domain-containing protein [Cyanobacteria bacterium REEB446]|nr:DUF1521 domain-containing protein [Cyanobacteria bacterium REEB446]
MSAINSVTHHALSTVAENSQVQAQNAAAINANSTDVDNTISRLAEARGTLNSPREDGANTLKSISIEQAEMDVSLSQAELIVYDGELSSNNIELQGVRSEISSKKSSLAVEEAKTEIRTSINADGNAEFITHSGIKIVTDTNKGGDQTWIYNPAGEQLMHIHGDPHVNMLKDADGNNGDDFHFGDDSTLKFEDGTELTFNTTETGKDTGIFYTTGIYVKAGDNVMHTGEATSGGKRRADIAKVDADSYSRAGDTAKGSVTMGLKGDGQILMQTGNQWNEIKDESWDGYLEDKTFNDQKGAAVDFKPQTIQSADGLSALKLEITQLEKKEAAHESRIAALTPLKSRAESNLDAAMSDLAKFSSMDDSEFVDNEESRQDVEQKSLDLSKRANDLGVFMSKSSLVGAGDLAKSGLDQAAMISDGVAADRALGGNTFDYRERGLEHSATRNDGTADLIDTLAALAEVGSFEEKSLEGDKLPEKNFTDGMKNFNDKFNSLSDSVARGTISITAAQNQLKIPAQDLLDNTDTITMKYEDFILDGEQSSEDAAKNPVVRFAQMASFQDLNQDILVDLENQMTEALAVDTDAGSMLENQMTEALAKPAPKKAFGLKNRVDTDQKVFGLKNRVDTDQKVFGLKNRVDTDAESMAATALRTEALRTEALRTEALRTEALRTEALRTELTNTKNLLTLQNGAAGLMGQLVDKVQIDFGDMSKEQAKALYDYKLNSLVDLENQQSEALTLNTDAGRRSATALNVELKLDRHVAKELERQFGFEKDDVLPERHEQSKFFVDLNKNILKDLEAQMKEALAMEPTEAGRISVGSLRNEINTTKGMLDFWTETAKFWKP